MKRYCTTILVIGVLFCSNMSRAQNEVGATATTVSSDGKTTTKTIVSANSSKTIITKINDADDTTNWKTREISKDFNVNPNAPIFIESAYRNLEIKTWDQPSVRIVANVRYKDDKDANLSFDEVFEKNGIKVKSSDGAFEILGLPNEKTSLYTMNYSYGIEPKGHSFSASPTNSITGLVYNGDNDSVRISASSISVVGDSVIFSKDTNQQELIKVFVKKAKDEQIKMLAESRGMQAKAIAERNKAIKKQDEAQKAKLATLSKQMETLSKKLALLTLEDADKNNKEITKLNQEIGKLSNQIAFQSVGNNFTFNFKMDSAKANWSKPIMLQLATPPSPPDAPLGHTFSSFYADQKTSRKWTIYIPKNHKVSVESKYGNIVLDNDVDNAKIISKYGNVETKNVDNLIVRNEYGNVNTNNVKNGDMEVRNGKLKMQNVDNLIIDSKNTSVDLNEVGNIKVESSNDNYDVSSVQALDANKNYGSFRLTTLNGKMNFNGINADIKIRNISPKVTQIDITNKFAKIALPFSDVKNYNIAVHGDFNDSFDDFNKQSNSNKGFSATGGNGKDLTTNINCNNCQLDFK